MGVIYKHINNNNGKGYVGLTTKTMEERWKEHLEDSERWDFKFYRALRKYGSECWTHEIIAEYDDEILSEAEAYWISYLDTFHNGYNSTTGGEAGYIISEETRNKMSIAQSGINHPFFGKHHSEETKQKISKSKLGIHLKISDDTRKKMIEFRKGNDYNLGKHHTNETKKIISASTSGKNNPMFGKHHTEETKQKLREAQIKYWEEKRILK